MRTHTFCFHPFLVDFFSFGGLECVQLLIYCSAFRSFFLIHFVCELRYLKSFPFGEKSALYSNRRGRIETLEKSHANGDGVFEPNEESDKRERRCTGIEKLKLYFIRRTFVCAPFAREIKKRENRVFFLISAFEWCVCLAFKSNANLWKSGADTHTANASCP